MGLCNGRLLEHHNRDLTVANSGLDAVIIKLTDAKFYIHACQANISLHRQKSAATIIWSEPDRRKNGWLPTIKENNDHAKTASLYWQIRQTLFAAIIITVCSQMEPPAPCAISLQLIPAPRRHKESIFWKPTVRTSNGTASGSQCNFFLKTLFFSCLPTSAWCKITPSETAKHKQPVSSFVWNRIKQVSDSAKDGLSECFRSAVGEEPPPSRSETLTVV